MRGSHLSMRFGHTPAAATAHAHVCEFHGSRHATFPCARSLASSHRPGQAQLPRYVSTSQSLSGKRRCDSGSRHGNRGPSCHLLQSAADPATRWASWRFVLHNGTLGLWGDGAPHLQPSLFFCLPLRRTRDGRVARLGQCSIWERVPLDWK